MRVLEAAYRRAAQHVLQLRADALLTVAAQKARHVILAQNVFGPVAGQLLGEGTEVGDTMIGAKNGDQAGSGLDESAKGCFTAFLGQRQPPSLGEPSQAGAQGVGVDGLEDVVRRPLPQSGDGSLQIGVARHDEDGRLGCQLSQTRQQLLGVTVGQPAIEQDG